MLLPPERPWPCSHLTTLRDGYIEVRHVFASVTRLGHLHLLDDVHAIHNLSEDDVLAVEERRGDRGDEELRAVGVGASVLVAAACVSMYTGPSTRLSRETVWLGKEEKGQVWTEGTKLNVWADKTTSKKDRSTHRHGEKAGPVMLQIEVLVREGLGAVYAGGPGSIAVEEVATLAHELGDLGEVCMFSKSSFELESYVCSRNVEGGKEIEARLTMR